MTKFALRYALAFILLVPAQGVVFNHMILFGWAVPMVFVWLIVSLPLTVGTNLSVLLGFLTGFGVDIFCDTPGVNALCCTLLAFGRKPLYHLYASYDDDLGGRAPSSASMGHVSYVKYILTAAAIYCGLVFTVEAFQLFNFKLWLLRVAASTIYTFVMLYALDCLAPRRAQ
ncbi:MAG: hypothetical protein K2L16_02715 [Muribaculaceae bacterium]|nr:hypothetical protein [Muribaculaceae bacterium]